MNGYIEVNITADGQTVTLYQHVVDGVVSGYVDATGAAVTPAKVREEHCVTGDLLAALP